MLSGKRDGNSSRSTGDVGRTRAVLNECYVRGIRGGAGRRLDTRKEQEGEGGREGRLGHCLQGVGEGGREGRVDHCLQGAGKGRGEGHFGYCLLLYQYIGREVRL